MEKIKALFAKKTVRLFAAVVTIACCLVVIGGLNRPHLNPFRHTLNLNYPTVVSYTDKGTVVLDNQSRRMLILTPDYQLKTVADMTMAGSPVDRMWSVNMYEDRIFVIGSTTFNQGSYVSSESVLEYDMRGKVIRTVYQQNYTEEERVTALRFSYVMAAPDGIYLTTISGRIVTVIRIGEQTETIGEWTLPEAIYLAGYSATGHYCVAVGCSQNCYYIEDNGSMTQVTLADYFRDLLSILNIPEESIDISALDGCYCIPSVVINADGNAQYYSVVNRDNEQVLVFTNDMSKQLDASKIEYSAGLMFRTIGYWLAVALLCVEAVILITWLLIKKLHTGGKLIFLAAFLIILISVFYTRQLTNASEKSYYNALVTQTKQFSYVVSRGYGQWLAAIRNTGIEAYCTDAANQDDIDEFRRTLTAMCSANVSEQSCFVSCYLLDSENALYTLIDSCYSEMSGKRVYLAEEAEQILDKSDHQPIVTDVYGETIVYDYDYITDPEGEPVGIICISGTRGNLRYVQVQNAVNTAVNLLALLIGLYMLGTMFKMFSADIKRRRERISGHIPGNDLELAGVFSFVQGIICSIDSVIIVYVARSLCESVNPQMQAIAVALPITLNTMGSTFGIRFSVVLSKRFGERKCAVYSCAMTVISMLLAAYAITVGNIYIYSAAKLLGGVFFGGVINTMRQTMPHRAEDERERKETLNSVLTCTFASTIVSALLGGYISHYLSYRAIYLAGAVLSLLFIILCVLCFKNGTNTNHVEEVHAADKKAYRKLFFTGPGLMLMLFYVLPGILMGGYTTYLFPMYTAGAGVSALLLSNLAVFVATFAFLTRSAFKSLLERLDRKYAMVVPMLVVCICLVCFIISPNIYWAIITLLIYEMMKERTGTSSWMHVTELAESRGLDTKTAFGKYLSLTNMMKNIQSPVLSQFVALGMNYACAALGAVCGILYSVFAIYNRRGTKENKS